MRKLSGIKLYGGAGAAYRALVVMDHILKSMWMDAERDDEEHAGGSGASDEGAYWRRRFLLLCAGVIALGVCAWLLPGARQAPGTSAASRASMAAAATRQSLPPAAYGAAWSSPTPSPSPSLSPSPADSANLAAKSKTGTSNHPQPAGSPTPSGADATCAPASIVLSLFTSQASYAQTARPQFTVYAVSTAATACTLTFGSGSVQLLVTNHGQVVWNSAACDPPAAKPVRFTLGVPQLLTVTWNRTAASPAGCAGSLPAGFTGSLRAVALSDGQSSPVRTFKVSK